MFVHKIKPWRNAIVDAFPKSCNIFCQRKEGGIKGLLEDFQKIIYIGLRHRPFRWSSSFLPSLHSSRTTPGFNGGKSRWDSHVIGAVWMYLCMWRKCECSGKIYKWHKMARKVTSPKCHKRTWTDINDIKLHKIAWNDIIWHKLI